MTLASGCLFPSLDDLGGSDASLVDAAIENVVASDAGDAGGDASIDAQLDAGPFCAQHPSATFCADFDESADAAAGFTSTYLTSGGVVALDTTTSATAPASLLAGNSVLDASSSSHGAEVRSTGVTPQNGVTLDLDLRIDKLASEGTYVEALAIVINGAVRSSIQLNLKAAASEVGEEIVGLDGGKTYVPHGFASALATSQWMHVTIAVVFQPSRTLTVTVGQNVVVDHVPLNAAFSASGAVDLYLGNAYAPGPSDGAAIHYDDALLVVN